MTSHDGMLETAYATNVVDMLSHWNNVAGDKISTALELMTSEEGVDSMTLGNLLNDGLKALIQHRELTEIYGESINEYTTKFEEEFPGGIKKVHAELLADPRIVKVQDFLGMTEEQREEMVRKTEENINKLEAGKN